MLFNLNSLEHTTIAYLPRIKRRSQAIYMLICFMIILSLCSLPFIYTDISVKSPGIIRPKSERTEIKPIISGIIDSIYVKEGQFVEKGNLLALLRDNTTHAKQVLNNFQIAQHQQYMHDLELLTTIGSNTNNICKLLQSPVYKQQARQFLYKITEQEGSLKKISHEINVDSGFSTDKLKVPRDLFDKYIETEKLQASLSAFKSQQLGLWEQELEKYKLEFSQITAQENQLQVDKKQFEIRAPVSGIVQGIDTKYNSSYIQANEALCIISPETELLAECFVSTQDIGLLKINQDVKFQVDAFDYNSFGIVTGKIIQIDNDFTVSDNKPVFKIHCSFDTKQLHLKNGFEGQLKKGLTLQASFIVTRRSLWQLLFDKIDDWLNPTEKNR